MTTKKRSRKKAGPREPRTQRNDALQQEVALLYRKLMGTDEPLTCKERTMAGLILEAVVGQGLPGWFPKTDKRPLETAEEHARIAYSRAWLAQHHPKLLVKHQNEILRLALGVKQNSIGDVPNEYDREATFSLSTWENSVTNESTIAALKRAVKEVRPQ